jgi:hypothetical protein
VAKNTKMSSNASFDEGLKRHSVEKPPYTDGAAVNVAEATDDDAYLEQMGYKQEFRRDFTFLGLFSLVSSELAVLPGVAGTIWCAAVIDGLR